MVLRRVSSKGASSGGAGWGRPLRAEQVAVPVAGDEGGDRFVALPWQGAWFPTPDKGRAWSAAAGYSRLVCRARIASGVTATRSRSFSTMISNSTNSAPS
jgi:hypothetical protein